MTTEWSLPTALGIGDRPEIVAVVGGGGKTSLLFALAAALPGRTIVTTTTRIFAAQMRHAPAVLYAEDLTRLDEILAIHGRCLVVGHVSGDKALGVDPDLPARLLAHANHVLVEADGSRMRPIKAPADHEPVIPNGTTLLIPVAGIDALAGPLDAVAHRPEKIREITNYASGISNEEIAITGNGHLTPLGIARVLTHPQGGLKGAPDGARVIPFINKVETMAELAAGRQSAAAMLRSLRVSRVVLGALRTAEPVSEVWRRVAAVVLAAGESRRMGRNKLLLPWGSTTVLGQTMINARSAGYQAVIAVTGHESDIVAEEIGTVGSIQIVHNRDYAKGMLTSVQAAVRALPNALEAALVILGDQPMVGPHILEQLLAAYAAGPQGLVAPVYRGRRGNPVLIDRRYFAELLALPPDGAPRLLLERHADDLRLLEVTDEAILHDLDRPEDYDRWRPGKR